MSIRLFQLQSNVIVVPFHNFSIDQIADLVAESEAQGFQFLRRLVDEWPSGANRFDRPGEVLLTSVSASRSVGLCGLNIDPYTSEQRVGRVRHLYIASEFRRRGIGHRLLTEIVAAARRSFDQLRLRTDDTHAARFYERFGFAKAIDLDACSHILNLRENSSG